MFTAALVVLALVFCLTGFTKLLAHPSMCGRAEHLGFSVGAFRLVGLAEVMGVAGALAGLVCPLLGVAAASGLALLTLGGATAHLRAGDGPKAVLPALVMALVCAWVVLGYLPLR